MTARLDIPGLAEEVNDTLGLLNEVRRRVQNWGAMGVRVEDRRRGATMDGLEQAKAEMEALRAAVEARAPKAVGQ